MDLNSPVKLDDLINEWKKDSLIDETSIEKEILKIPNLHSKYVGIMAIHQLIVKKLISDYNKKKKIKWEYEQGLLNNPEDLKRLNLEPKLNKTLRIDLPIYLDGDDDLNIIILKKSVNEEIVDMCKSIIKELNNRTWQLKTFVDYQKFISGH